MDYKTILVHLDRGARRSERLELALTLAERYDAHLVGLFAVSEIRMPSYVRTDTSRALIAAQNRQLAEAAIEEYDRLAACPSTTSRRSSTS